RELRASQISDTVEEGIGRPAQEREPGAQCDEPHGMAGPEDVPIPHADIGSEQTRDEGQRQDESGDDRQDIDPAADLGAGATGELDVSGVVTAGVSVEFRAPLCYIVVHRGRRRSSTLRGPRPEARWS